MDAFGGLRRALSGSDLPGRSLGASRIPSGDSDTMVIKKKKILVSKFTLNNFFDKSFEQSLTTYFFKKL